MIKLFEYFCYCLLWLSDFSTLPKQHIGMSTITNLLEFTYLKQGLEPSIRGFELLRTTNMTCSAWKVAPQASMPTLFGLHWVVTCPQKRIQPQQDLFFIQAVPCGYTTVGCTFPIRVSISTINLKHANSERTLMLSSLHPSVPLGSHEVTS